MKALSKTEIASVQPARLPLPVPVPEWGPDCGIFALQFDGRQRESLLKAVKGGNSDYLSSVKTLAMAACSETGELIFTSEDEVEKTITDPVVVVRVAEEILRNNGLLKGAVEQAVKN